MTRLLCLLLLNSWVLACGGTNLPIVHLNATLPIVSDPKVPCTVQLDSPSRAGSDFGTLPGVVCIHGGISQSLPKKSYRFTLEKPASWLGMRSSTHWVLNASTIDRSLMRHKLSYDLFLSLASPATKRFAAQSRFVEVQLNGDYHGVYLLMERVDRALLELRRFDSNAPNHACIFKAVDHAANFSRTGHSGYEQREPEFATRSYWEPLNDFNRFVSRAPDAEFLDANLGIVSRLDLENAIDFHLLVLLTSNGDGITKNFMIARDVATAGSPAPRFFFVPWDYDATFGRNWNAGRVEPDVWLTNHLFNRLHADAAFRRNFAARWAQLRKRQFASETIQRMIEENARTLGEAAQRNATRWRSLGGIYPDRVTFEQDLAQMKEWVQARTRWLDSEIAKRAN